MSIQETKRINGFFKDFDFSMVKNPLTNDIGSKTDLNAINQSLRNLLSTNFYERAFHPEIGSNIRRILFEPADAITIADLRQAITETVENFEPRVDLLDLIITDNSSKNSYSVKLIYQINLKETPVELDVVLERIR